MNTIPNKEHALTSGLIQAAAYIESGRVQMAANIIHQTLVDYRANIVSVVDVLAFDRAQLTLNATINGKPVSSASPLNPEPSAA